MMNVNYPCCDGDDGFLVFFFPHSYLNKLYGFLIIC